MTIEITPAGYCKLVSAILAKGYKIRRLADVQVARSNLILRYDIDPSLNAAAIEKAARGECAMLESIAGLSVLGAFFQCGVEATRHLVLSV